MRCQLHKRILPLLLGLSHVTAFAMLQEWEFKPQVGMDVSSRWQDFESDFGEDHFRAHYPDFNFYLGTYFYKYLGLEAGYEQMLRQDKKRFYREDQPVLGFANTLNPSQNIYHSETFMHGWHVDLVGFWPICPKTQTELTALIGLAWLTLHYQTVPNFDVNSANPIAMWESDTRAVFRWGVGVRQMVTENFGLRLQAVWENTSKLEATTVVPFDHFGAITPLSSADNYTAKPENSYKVGVGFFFQMA